MEDDVFEYYIDFKEIKLVSYKKILPEFKFDINIPFHDMIIPTQEYMRYTNVITSLA